LACNQFLIDSSAPAHCEGGAGNCPSGVMADRLRSGGGSVMPAGGGRPRCGFDILSSEPLDKEGRRPALSGGECLEAVDANEE
jgi:hypothetical protein